MKAIIMFTLILLFTIYFSFQAQVQIKDDYLTEIIAINILNLVIVIFLLISSLIVIALKRNTNTQLINEDMHYKYIENKISKLSIILHLSIIVSIVTLVIGFLLLRDIYPKVSFFTFVLLILSIIYSMICTDLISKLKYGKPIPNPKSKDYQNQVFMSYDDGQKYLMLKTLYKLYYKIQFGLVLFIFILMFYSLITGHSQILGITGIGIILIYMIICFEKGMHLKE